jgi:hypothetical protein
VGDLAEDVQQLGADPSDAFNPMDLLPGALKKPLESALLQFIRFRRERSHRLRQDARVGNPVGLRPMRNCALYIRRVPVPVAWIGAVQDAAGGVCALQPERRPLFEPSRLPVDDLVRCSSPCSHDWEGLGRLTSAE